MPSVKSKPRGTAEPAPVPAFFLYGEPPQPPDEGTVHVETIAARSQLHNWNIAAHRHRDLHQVLIAHAGRADIRLDGRHVVLRGPAVIIVPPGTVHAFRFQIGMDGLVISFASALARDVANGNQSVVAFLERPAAVPLAEMATGATDIAQLGTMLLKEFERSAPGRVVALRGLVGALLANVLRVTGAQDAESSGSETRERELVARFRHAIEHHYREHVSVTAYAHELGVSDARLRRACLAATGQSPVALVHLRMLVEAERQLRYTTMSIAQVAYYLGFDDPAYFSRFFAQRMRISPQAFRRRGAGR